MRVLITGGAGFIGANLVGYLNRHSPETEVVVLDDLSTGRVTNLRGKRADFIEGSVVDKDVVASAFRGVDAVVHLAALGSVPRSVKDPVSSHVANLDGTLNVLEEARKSDTYVAFASSSSVYGANSSLPKSEYDWTRPMSPYAVTKLGAEAYVLAYQYSYGLPTLAFRFFNVYGPLQPADHDYAAVIPRFMDAIANNRTLKVEGDGEQSRDFTFVETVCSVLYSAVMGRVVDPDPVNLAFGTSTTINELVSAVEVATGLGASVNHVEPRTGDVRASQSDGKRVRELFPDVQPTSLSRGLALTSAWFVG